jgi:GLPGLI family protein
MNILNLFCVVICFCASLNAQTYKFTYAGYEDSVAIVTESLDMGNTQESAEREKYRRNYVEWKSVYYRDGQSRVQFDSIIHKDKKYKDCFRAQNETYTQYYDFKLGKGYYTDDSIALGKIAEKPLEKLDWDTSDKIIYEINNFKCRKATREVVDGSLVTVWYTSDIPIQSCFQGDYYGLPGLLVKCDWRGRYIANLVKIETLKENMEIIPLKTRTMMSIIEFEADQQNSVMQRYFNPRPRK